MERVLDLFPVCLCDSRRAAALVAFDLLQPERARRRGPYNQNETSDASHHSRRSAHGGAHYRARAKAGTRVDPVPAGAADACAGESSGGNRSARVPGPVGGAPNPDPLRNRRIPRGRLELLASLYKQVLIPPAVFGELAVSRDALPVMHLASVSWIVLETPRNQDRVQELREVLDAGEAEAIVLAVERQAELLLVDENAGDAWPRR